MTALPRSEYPRPQWFRPQWLSLNGKWSFGQDDGANGEFLGWHERPQLPERIVVPFAPESRLSGIGRTQFMPCVWYSRKFAVPAAWKGQRVLLHFGAVDYDARVWVNGRLAGGHRGGYTPFHFDITDLLHGGENLLVVQACDDPRRGLQPCGKQSFRFESFGCHYTRVTGIWQSVWLEPVGRSYIAQAKFIGSPAAAQLAVEALIEHPQPGLVLKVTARMGSDIVGRLEVPVQGPVAVGVVGLSRVRRWDVDDPFLYDLDLELSAPSGTMDRVESYFGLRTIELAPPAVLLNGRPVFQRLVLDQGYYPDGIYTARSDAMLKRDIVLSRQLGFNGARLHQKVFEPGFLHWADRLGYLVWGEYGDWGIRPEENSEALRRLQSEWAEAVERDFNHPSIVGWCPTNETRVWPDRQMLADLYRLTKRLDPTRPVIDTSGYHHAQTDIYDVHDYEQDPAKLAARYAPLASGGPAWQNDDKQAAYAGQCYFVSEYGGIWWKPGQAARDASWGYGQRPTTLAEFMERYRGLTTALLEHPRMCGFCYTQLYDVEQEVNGLMTYGRKMKFDPAAIAAINRQKAKIEK